MNTAEEGATALVTGAARGIGAAVAEAFARSGARVALLDLDRAVERRAEELAAAGAHTCALVADVADPAAVEDAVVRAEERLGPVTALANVAGILRTGPIDGLDRADLMRSFAVNAVGVFNTGRAVGARMHRRGAGSIVTVASNAAATPRTGMAAYSASKAAAAALTRSLGLELAPHVRCNTVCPGSTDTGMLRSLRDDPAAGLGSAVDGDPRRYRLGIPLRRVAEPEDVASAVLFLASPAARHITMQSLTVDGGATLGA